MPKSSKKEAKKPTHQQKIADLVKQVAHYKKELDFFRTRLASFSDYNPRPITEVDFKGNVLYINPQTRENFPDLKKRGMKHPYFAGLKSILSDIKKRRKGISREIKIGNVWWRQNIHYIPLFNVVRIFGLNITENKNLEQSMRESEARYHMLFEKMNYGYALQDIIFDEKGKPVDYKFIDVNPAFEKLTKMKKEMILGKTANQIARNPETPESIATRKKYDQVAVTGKPLYLENYNETTKKYFELYAYMPNKKQMALIFSDITDRKKTDEEKNNFISIMSHELRNPLTPIMANAQFLQRKDFTDPIAKEAIDIIEKQSRIMADLLNDILDVSRLSRRQITLKKSRINISDVIHGSVKSSMPFITTKQQDLSLLLSKRPVYLYADPLRLEQILVNVINNASKYTPPKGHISIQCQPKNGHVEIRVKDNGEGMSQDKISRIFDLFKGENQPFMGVGGLGIGLNLVKNLVQMHKGTVHVTSKGKGKGSEFIITLPIEATKSKSKKAELPEAGESKAPGEKTSRILVVDDNADIRNAISNILVHEGYQVKSTHDGSAAIKISKTFKPHTALIDIGLPGISGYKVAKILREQHDSKDRKIKLIAFTGYGQEKDKQRAKEAGFDVHLTKPLNIDHLMRYLT
ncbi:response regulator [Candidatus Parcubacteria bacterium]|nr:response regulator [Candidatus Parcubacteria bacterium]